MPTSRLTPAAATVAAAGVLLSCLLAGCGLGPGEERGSASLLVTRDYGREVLLEETADLRESSTAMRLLDESADVETRYGGGFVQSVDGLAGGRDGGRSFDWFFSVNGVVAERGSADFPVREGDTVWWDHRDWTDAMEIGAVVGAYPAPFAGGYDERDWPVAIDCRGDSAACGAVKDELEDDGIELEPDGAATTDTGSTVRVVVGTWEDVKDLPEGRRLAGGAGRSGVFARFAETAPGEAPARPGLVGLGVTGDPVQDFGPEAGLVAAMRRADDPPVWLLTGGSEAGVEAAASALNREDLQHRYAAVVTGGRIASLPLR